MDSFKTTGHIFKTTEDDFIDCIKECNESKNKRSMKMYREFESYKEKFGFLYNNTSNGKQTMPIGAWVDNAFSRVGHYLILAKSITDEKSDCASRPIVYISASGIRTDNMYSCLFDKNADTAMVKRFIAYITKPNTRVSKLSIRKILIQNKLGNSAALINKIYKTHKSKIHGWFVENTPSRKITNERLETEYHRFDDMCELGSSVDLSNIDHEMRNRGQIIKEYPQYTGFSLRGCEVSTICDFVYDNPYAPSLKITGKVSDNMFLIELVRNIYKEMKDLKESRGFDIVKFKPIHMFFVDADRGQHGMEEMMENYEEMDKIEEKLTKQDRIDLGLDISPDWTFVMFVPLWISRENWNDRRKTIFSNNVGIVSGVSTYQIWKNGKFFGGHGNRCTVEVGKSHAWGPTHRIDFEDRPTIYTACIETKYFIENIRPTKYGNVSNETGYVSV